MHLMGDGQQGTHSDEARTPSQRPSMLPAPPGGGGAAHSCGRGCDVGAAAAAQGSAAPCGGQGAEQGALAGVGETSAALSAEQMARVEASRCVVTC